MSSINLDNRTTTFLGNNVRLRVCTDLPKRTQFRSFSCPLKKIFCILGLPPTSQVSDALSLVRYFKPGAHDHIERAPCVLKTCSPTRPSYWYNHLQDNVWSSESPSAAGNLRAIRHSRQKEHAPQGKQRASSSHEWTLLRDGMFLLASSFRKLRFPSTYEQIMSMNAMPSVCWQISMVVITRPHSKWCN